MSSENGRRSFGYRALRTRWFVRAPILLYRARLGFLMGHRMLLLEHVGRTSGLPRLVVLEVVDHPLPHRYVVVSGLGPRSQWYRNIVRTPRVRVTIGSRSPAPATARVLDRAVAEEALARYAAAHPKAYARLKPIMEEAIGTSITDAGQLPFVALDLDTDGPAVH